MLFGLYGSIGLLLVAVVWCSQVVRTLPEDLRTFRASREPTERAVQAVIWALSALFALWTLGTLVGAARALVTVLG